MKVHMNDATDLFGNAFLIQPQIITINGKKINLNNKNDKNEKKKKETNLEKIERSQIEQDMEDSNSYEIILSKILDKPPIDIEKEMDNLPHSKKHNNHKDNNTNEEKKKNNKIEHSTITKKKLKNNLLVIPSEDKFQRRKTSSFDVNNFQNIVLSEMENKKEKKIIDIKTPQRFSSDKSALPKMNNFQLQSQNFLKKSNLMKDIDLSTIKDLKSDIGDKSNTHINEKLNFEELLFKKEKKLDNNFIIQKVFDFEIGDNTKKVNNKPVYVLTNQIVNINKKNIINNVDKDIKDIKSISELQSENKIETKEECIQTDEMKLRKNHLNFMVQGKKKSFLGCF
jgi:hypothetical protein